ncbi:uncharacterized protein METZ01_LOCUS224535, partial [marine metagenome]|jgi:hypothetical protein
VKPFFELWLMVILPNDCFREICLLIMKYIYVICFVSLAGCRTSDQSASRLKQIPSPLYQEAKSQAGFAAQVVLELPLHAAVDKGDKIAITKYLAAGVAIDSKNQFGITPLHTATIKGKSEIVSMLLKHGAKLDEVSYGKQTALHFAALNGNALIAELLVDNGASVNSIDHENWTPLDCALLGGKGITFTNIDGKKAVAELLVSNGGRKGNEISRGHD